ncbi:hypothetical protein GGR54DRAFT_648372 [Hypoxylon sp. NC1633]|nr:hypothetical protein GGR54DRAFT_648372 [Hypoxylon sp. NC1633]
MPVEDRHGPADETKVGEKSLRRRLIRSLNRRRSFPAWQPVEFRSALNDTPEEQPSFIRKSLSSVSSSLKSHLLSDSPADSEAQSQSSSVIRKSLSSMSSSVRGIRSSMSSRLSRDTERRSATVHYGNLPEAEFMGHFSIHSRRRTAGQASNISCRRDSIPQLPDLEEMMAHIKKEKTSTDDQSRNSLFSMSIFDCFDNPTAVNWEDKDEGECDEPTERQPTPIVGRLPIRLKRPDARASRGESSSNTARGIHLRTSVDSGCSGCSNEIDSNLAGVTSTTKLPKEWLERILETSIDVRNDTCEVHVSVPQNETDEERLRRLGMVVYVFVPDDDNPKMPWPKISYPDLKAALVDLCTRFKPYYAPFAAYTGLTRTIQLFSPDFKIDDHESLSPGVTIFNIQEALDNWDAPTSLLSIIEEDRETEEQTISDRTFTTITEPPSEGPQEYVPLHTYDLGVVSMDEDRYDDMVESDTSCCDENRPPKQSNHVMMISELGKSYETLSTDDDMAVTSQIGLGFIA